MRGISAILLVCLFAVPISASPPVLPVVAVGVAESDGSFSLYWSAPPAGSGTIQAMVVTRTIGIGKPDNIVLPADARVYVDSTPADTVVQYVVSYVNDDGPSPGSNPVLRGEWPRCNAIRIYPFSNPLYQIEPGCILPLTDP